MVRTVFFTDLDSPFGIPHFFELLEASECEVVAVVLGPRESSATEEPMPVVDRWGQTVRRDVLATATERGIPVLCRAEAASADFVESVRQFSADLFVSAGFRRVLSPGVLALPRRGAINFHPSRLPRVRGRDPWFWTIATGETETAVTVHHMVERVDAGNIVLQVPVGITAAETASSLRHKTTVESLRAVRPLLDMASRGPLAGTPQDIAGSRAYPDPSDSDRTIDWCAPAATIDRLIRACLIAPGAITHYRGREVRVVDAEPGRNREMAAIEAKPGAVLNTTAYGVAVKAGDGHVVLRRLEVDGQACAASHVVGFSGGEGARDCFS